MSEREVWQEHSSLLGHMSRFPSHSARKQVCPVQTLSWDLPEDALPPVLCTSDITHISCLWDRSHPCYTAVHSTSYSRALMCCHRTQRFVVCHQSSAWLKLQDRVSVTALPWEPKDPRPFQVLYPKSPRNCQAPHSFIPRPLKAMFIVQWIFQQIELKSFNKSFLALRFSNSRSQKITTRPVLYPNLTVEPLRMKNFHEKFYQAQQQLSHLKN